MEVVAGRGGTALRHLHHPHPSKDGTDSEWSASARDHGQYIGESATYIETHLGGGAIMRRKPAALRNIGIDLDASATTASSSCTAAPTGIWPSSSSEAPSSSTATRRI